MMVWGGKRYLVLGVAAACVLFAVTRPLHVVVDELVVTSIN